MKNKAKKAARKSLRVPPWVWAVGALAVMGVVPWLLLAPGSERSSAPGGGSLGPVQWTPLVSQQHGFRISLPAPARNQTPAVDIAREIDSTWAAAYQGGTVVLKVARCPEKLCTQVPDTILESASKSAREELGGTLLSEKRVEVPCPHGTCPGLEFQVTSSQGWRVSGWLVATHTRVFQLLSTQQSGTDEHFRKMVESFTFL
jgi:hypothetical protein